MEWNKVKFIKITEKEFSDKGRIGLEYELFWDGTIPVNIYTPIVVIYDMDDIQIDTWAEINFKYYHGALKKETFHWAELPKI